MRVLKAFLVLTLLFPVIIRAQEDSKNLSLRATPQVLGMQRPTGFVIGYEGVMNYKISSVSPEYLGSSSAEVINDRRVFAKVKIPVIGLVENMAGDIFGKGGVEELAKKQDVEYLGSLELDKRITESGDTGHPFVVNDDDITTLFGKIVAKVKDFCEK